MKITAWKCQYTGSIFESEDEYNKHRAAHYRFRKRVEKTDKEYQAVQDQWKHMGESVANIKELEEYIARNWDVFVTNYRQQSSYTYHARHPMLLDISFKNMKWQEETGKWKGYLELRLAKDPPSFGSIYFDWSPISTGGGGSWGQLCWRWSVELRAIDFPLMKDSHERARVWNILADKEEHQFI